MSFAWGRIRAIRKAEQSSISTERSRSTKLGARVKKIPPRFSQRSQGKRPSDRRASPPAGVKRGVDKGSFNAPSITARSSQVHSRTHHSEKSDVLMALQSGPVKGMAFRGPSSARNSVDFSAFSTAPMASFLRQRWREPRAVCFGLSRCCGRQKSSPGRRRRPKSRRI